MDRGVCMYKYVFAVGLVVIYSKIDILTNFEFLFATEPILSGVDMNYGVCMALSCQSVVCDKSIKFGNGILQQNFVF